MSKDKKPASDLVVLEAPEGCTGCSHDGVEYEVVEGLVEVPAAAIDALIHHGFTPEKKKPAVKEEAPRSNGKGGR